MNELRGSLSWAMANQRLLNLIVHQNHLESLKKHKVLGSIPSLQILGERGQDVWLLNELPG